MTIIGPGRLGSALALALRDSGYPIRQILARPTSLAKARALAKRVGAKASQISRFEGEADVLWICVPDREIAGCARLLAPSFANWHGKYAFHTSGALDSDELAPLHQRGAQVASVHPLMTFAKGAKPVLKDVGFALEGDRAAVRLAGQIVRQLGGESYSVHKRHKVAYHAWGAFASPLLVALLVTAERVAELAGVTPAAARRRMLPILRETVENYARLGPANSFTGPIVRGDLATVRRHLTVLRKSPLAREAYRALAHVALESLPADDRAGLRRVLRRKPGSASEAI